MAALSDPFWTSLAAKMATTAVLVLLASFIVERAGPFLGAMVATLPISAGPAYAFLAAEHGGAFVAESAILSLVMDAVTAVFAMTYAFAARRFGTAVSLGIAGLAWLALAAAAVAVPWTMPAAILATIAAFAVAIAATRRLAEEPVTARARPRWWDIPVRVVAVMVVVAAVVLSGRWLGPRAAGIVALLPVVFCSLIVILQPRIGGSATGAVLVNSLPGLVGLGVGLVVLHVAAVPLGAPAALTLALATCVIWNGGLVALRNARMRSAPVRQRVSAMSTGPDTYCR